MSAVAQSDGEERSEPSHSARQTRDAAHKIDVIWLTLADLHHEINVSEKAAFDLGKLLSEQVVIVLLFNRDIGIATDDEMQSGLVRSFSTRKGKHIIESTDPRMSGAAGGDSRR